MEMRQLARRGATTASGSATSSTVIFYGFLQTSTTTNPSTYVTSRDGYSRTRASTFGAGRDTGRGGRGVGWYGTRGVQYVFELLPVKGCDYTFPVKVQGAEL